jgi:hypothetical protein
VESAECRQIWEEKFHIQVPTLKLNRIACKETKRTNYIYPNIIGKENSIQSIFLIISMKDPVK